MWLVFGCIGTEILQVHFHFTISSEVDKSIQPIFQIKQMSETFNFLCKLPEIEPNFLMLEFYFVFPHFSNLLLLERCRSVQIL